MKKYIFSVLVLATSLVACTGDYTDWGVPMSNAQPETVSFGNGSVTAVDLIDFANETTASLDSVKVCSIVAPTASDATYNNATYKLYIGDETYDIAANGLLSADDLQSYVEATYGKAPTERDMTAYVEQWISNGTTTVKTATSGEFTIKVKLAAPHISTGYYLVGDMFTNGEEYSGWAQKAAEDHPFKRSSGTSIDELYKDPYFTITFTTTADNQYWKIIPQENVDAGNIWADGVVGPAVDGATDMTGALVNDGAQAGKIEKAGKYKMTIDMLNYTYTIKEVSYDPYIYYVGTANGWNNKETGISQKLALTDDATGKYAGYIFCKEESYGNTFRFFKTYNSWDNADCYGNSDVTTYEGPVEAGASDNNFSVTGGEGVYYVELCVKDGTFKVTKIDYMGITGDFCGWNEGVEMTWNATDWCYEGTASVTANGWKFRANGLTDSTWAVNLGGDITNLTQGGDNLSVVGSTIKLYPCRTTNDNIYCTVE